MNHNLMPRTSIQSYSPASQGKAMFKMLAAYAGAKALKKTTDAVIGDPSAAFKRVTNAVSAVQKAFRNRRQAPRNPSTAMVPSVRSTSGQFQSAPVAVSQAYRTMSSGRSLSVHAAEQYGDLEWTPAGSLTTNATAGALLKIPLNPIFWRGTRISDMLTAYYRWTVRSAKIQFRPSLGTTYGGFVSAVSVAGAQSFSPRTDPSTFNTSMSSLPGFMTGPVYTPFVHNAALDRKANDVMHPIASDSFAYVCVTGLTAAVLPTVPTVVGQIFIEYDVVLDTPVIPWVPVIGNYFISSCLANSNAMYTFAGPVTANDPGAVVHDAGGNVTDMPMHAMVISAPGTSSGAYTTASGDASAPGHWHNDTQPFVGQRYYMQPARNITPAITGLSPVNALEVKVADFAGLDASSVWNAYYNFVAPTELGIWLRFECIAVGIRPANRFTQPIGAGSLSLARSLAIEQASSEQEASMTTTTTTTTTSPEPMVVARGVVLPPIKRSV